MAWSVERRVKHLKEKAWGLRYGSYFDGCNGHRAKAERAQRQADECDAEISRLTEAKRGIPIEELQWRPVSGPAVEFYRFLADLEDDAPG